MMATVSAIEAFPTNDDIFDAEVDDDSSDGGQEEAHNPELNNELSSSTEVKTNEKDDIFDDGGSPQVPQTAESSDESEKDNDEERLGSSIAKSSRSPKPRKLKKAAIQSIHSECQRMLRDSCVKLPYYTPAVKPITHFLTRVPINISPATKTASKPVDEDSNKPENGISTPPSFINGLKEAKDSITPKLSDANDPFFFDETPTDKLPTKGVQKLMQRFEKHTKKPKEVKKEIIILDSETTEKDHQPQSLKKPDKPIQVGRLQALKEQLEVKMKKQREEQRKIHESQRKLDNEEISDEEEEEAEFSYESDSDFELDKWNAEDEEIQEEEDNQAYKPAQNEFIDAEADEEDEDLNSIEDNSGSDGDISDEGQSDNEGNSALSGGKIKQPKPRHKKHNKSKGTHPSSEERMVDSLNGNSNSQNFSEESQGNSIEEDSEKSQGLCLRLDSVDDEDDDATDGFTKMKNFKSPEASLSSQLTSDLTNDSSNIEPGQGEGGRSLPRQESDSEISSMLPPISRHNKENLQNRPRKIGKLSQLTLPVEDSQDLFDSETRDEEPQDKLSVVDGFSIAIGEESQMSQLLDTQGFLFSTKKQKKQNSKDVDVAMDNTDMAEILGLCSGQFTGGEANLSIDATKRKPKSLLGKFITDENSQSSQMDELLGLCSGMFSSKNVLDSSSNDAKYDRTTGKSGHGNDSSNEAEHDFNFKDGDDDKDNEDNDNLEDADNDGNDDSDEDELDKDENNDDDGVDDDEESYIDMDKIRAKKKRRIQKIFDKKKFYEEEAELSGSDVGSDEDEDIDTDDDILEEESDQEELPSDEELQNQINRVHMKSILDQDKAELRLMQDIYLQDGDLHGAGRKRNFRWRGIDFNSQADLFGNRMWNDDDDNANIELLTEEESKRRKERFERDTFIREEMEKANTNQEIADLDENSQVILNIIKDTSNAAPTASPSVPDKPQPSVGQKQATPAPRIQRIPSQKGSFLNRSKATLNRLSNITASAPNSTSNGRSFVFKAVDEKTKPENSKKMPRTLSVIEPAAKRPKFDRSMSETTSNSVFSMF